MLKKSLAPLVFAASVVALPGVSFAAGVPASAAFDAFMWSATGGASQTVGFSASGTPVLTPAVPLIETDGGLPKVTTSGSLPTPSGGRLPVTATGRIPAAQVGKAVGRFLGKTLPLLATGYALFDLAKELGFTLDNSTGAVVVSKPDPSVCTSAPCAPEYRMRFDHSSATPWTSWTTNPASACAAVNGQSGVSYSGDTRTVTSVTYYSPSNCALNYSSNWGSNYSGGASAAIETRTPQVTTNPTSLPSSQQEFIDAVAAKSGWPSTSRLAEVLADPKASQDVKIKTDSPTVTGPATTTGPSKVTTNTTNNTTKTETTTHNHTYGGAKVNTTTNISVVTVDNSTGAVIDQSTSTDSAPKAEEQAITCGLPGTPACKMDETGTPEAYAPDRYKEIGENYKTAVDARRETVSGTADKGFLSGWTVLFSAPAVQACTPITLPNGMSAVSMGTIDPCPVVDGVRSVMAYLWAIAGFWLCLGMVKRTF